MKGGNKRVGYIRKRGWEALKELAYSLQYTTKPKAVSK